MLTLGYGVWDTSRLCRYVSVTIKSYASHGVFRKAKPSTSLVAYALRIVRLFLPLASFTSPEDLYVCVIGTCTKAVRTSFRLNCTLFE